MSLHCRKVILIRRLKSFIVTLHNIENIFVTYVGTVVTIFIKLECNISAHLFSFCRTSIYSQKFSFILQNRLNNKIENKVH